MIRALFYIFPAICCLAQTPIRGYPAEQWKTEHDLEQQARALPSAERIRIYMERMSAKPHHAGSAGGKAVAEYAAALLKEWGLDTHVEIFEPLLPYPTSRLLEMTAPVRFRAQLNEPAIPEDPDTSEAGQLPTFNAFSASGDVTAPLIYVNFGIPEDYETLRQLGLDVRGKIVIARYGRA